MSNHPYNWIRIIPQHAPRGAATVPTFYDANIEYGFIVELSSEAEKPADDAQPAWWFRAVVKDQPPERWLPRVQGLLYERTLDLLELSDQPQRQSLGISSLDAARMQQLNEKKVSELSNWYPIKRGGLSSYGSD